MTFTWDLVTKNVERYAQLEEKLREKISKLEKHLQRFPPDAIHLHTHLEKNPKKPLYTASLTLRLPSNTLHSDKTEDDPMPAFDEAVKALLRELEHLKASLRKEDQWNRRQREETIGREEPTQFAARPQARSRESQSLPEVVSEMFQQHYSRLVRYAWRQLWRAELLGEIPRNAIDPRMVTDEVAKQVFLTADQKPPEQNYRLWFYAILRHDLKKRIAQFEGKAASAKERSNSESSSSGIGNSESSGEPYDDEEKKAVLRGINFEPERLLIGEWLPGDEWSLSSPIDALVSRGEFLGLMKSVAQSWSELGRAVFELHFLEGFGAEEVAVLEGRESREVSRKISDIKKHLQQFATHASAEA